MHAFEYNTYLFYLVKTYIEDKALGLCDLCFIFLILELPIPEKRAHLSSFTINMLLKLHLLRILCPFYTQLLNCASQCHSRLPSSDWTLAKKKNAKAAHRVYTNNPTHFVSLSFFC